MADEFERWKAEEAAAYLKHVRRLSLDIRRIQDEIEVQRSLIPSATDYTRERVKSSPAPDALERAALKVFDLIDEYCTELAEYIEAQREAHDSIRQLKDARHRAVLTLYYVDGHSWETVGKMLRYETQTVKNLRGEALPYFWDVMPKDEKTRIPRSD